MNELLDKIRSCKTRDELDAMRLPIVKYIETHFEEAEAIQKAFRKQLNKIRYGRASDAQESHYPQ